MLAGRVELWRRTIISIAKLGLIECEVEAYEDDADPTPRGSEDRSAPSSHPHNTVSNPVAPHPQPRGRQTKQQRNRGGEIQKAASHGSSCAISRRGANLVYFSKTVVCTSDEVGTARIASRTLREIPAASRPTSASCSRRVAWPIMRSGMPSRVIESVESRWLTAYSIMAVPKPF
jgi:hypothetical protein